LNLFLTFSCSFLIPFSGFFWIWRPFLRLIVVFVQERDFEPGFNQTVHIFGFISFKLKFRVSEEFNVNCHDAIWYAV
jgi:hypothetical protein